MKTCPKCKKEFEGRAKYCSGHCKYWFNQIRKDNERHLPPVRKRTDDYFLMCTGAQPNSLRGQGRRSGSMVKGSMSARVMIMTEEVVEVNIENLRRHFLGNNFELKIAKLCGGGIIEREKFLEGYNAIKFGVSKFGV